MKTTLKSSITGNVQTTLLLTIILGILPVLRGNVTEPANAGWINVSASYGAIPNDGIDDTSAIQQAISENIGVRTNMRILYFPDGVYNISETLEWRNTAGDWKAYIHLQGESREGTILRLDDQVFTDAANAKAVLFTASSGSDSTGNTAFANYIQDMTIDTGVGNPGAIGINYLASNVGAVRRVNVRSSDPLAKGRAGILMDRNFAGPAILELVDIEGFDYGIDFENQNKFSMTFKDVSLSNQRVVGIRNNQNAIAIEGLVSHNTVPVLQGNSTNGHTVILNSIFNNGATDEYAIEFMGALLLRDVAINGYRATPIKNNNKNSEEGSSYVEEYVSHPTRSQFPSPDGTLRLPVKQPPEGPSAPVSDWIKVGSYNSSGVQAAIDAAASAGKSTVYFPNGQYNLSTKITVHGSVRRLVGNHAFLNWNPAAGDTAVFELNGLTGPDFTFEQFILSDWASGEPMYSYIRDLTTVPIVFRDIMQTITDGIPYSHTLPKEIYMVNCAMGEITFNGAKVWAWQLDPENNGPIKIINNGGDLRVVGFKTEWASTSLKTSNAGRSEILGAMFYVPFGSKSLTIPAVINDESELSLSMTCYGDYNDIRIRDIRGATTLDYKHANSVSHRHPRDARTVPLYNSWIAPEAPTAPSGLQVTNLEANKVDLEWTDNASTEEAFLVERKPADGDWETLVNGLPANQNSYSDSTVNPNSNYDYRVFAVTSGIRSASSNEVTASTPPLETIPALESVTVINSTTLELAFSEPVQPGTGTGGSEDPSRYSIDPGISVLEAARQANPSVVQLTVSSIPYDNEYTLSVSGITAEGGGPALSETTAFIYLSGSAYYTLDVGSDNGSVERSPSQNTYTSGSVVTLTALPDTNYSFSNWSGDLSGTDNPALITIDSAKSVFAHFVVDTQSVFAYEPFAYTGILTGNSGGLGWSGPWTITGGSDWAITTELTHSNMLPSAANASFGNQDKVRRTLDRSYGNDDGSVIYLSYLMQADNDPETGLWSNFELLMGGDSDSNRKLSVGLQDSNATDFRIRLFNNDNFTKHIAAADTTVHQFILKIEFNPGVNDDRVSVWMDPGLPSSAYAMVDGNYDFDFDRVVLSSWRQSMTIDEIRIGSSWQSVTTAAPPDYAGWSAGFLTPIDGDENGDGVTNILAYALGASPQENALLLLPEFSHSSNYFTYSLHFTQKSDIHYQILASDDMSAWMRVAYKSIGVEWLKDETYPWSSDIILTPTADGVLLEAYGPNLPRIQFYRTEILLP